MAANCWTFEATDSRVVAWSLALLASIWLPEVISDPAWDTCSAAASTRANWVERFSTAWLKSFSSAR